MKAYTGDLQCFRLIWLSMQAIDSKVQGLDIACGVSIGHEREVLAQNNLSSIFADTNAKLSCKSSISRYKSSKSRGKLQSFKKMDSQRRQFDWVAVSTMQT